MVFREYRVIYGDRDERLIIILLCSINKIWGKKYHFFSSEKHADIFFICRRSSNFSCLSLLLLRRKITYIQHILPTKWELQISRFSPLNPSLSLSLLPPTIPMRTTLMSPNRFPSDPRTPWVCNRKASYEIKILKHLYNVKLLKFEK